MNFKSLEVQNNKGVNNFGKDISVLGKNGIIFGKDISVFPWDGSCIPFPEDKKSKEVFRMGVYEHVPFEVIIDILKGVFFLPQIGMHVIRTGSPDGVRSERSNDDTTGVKKVPEVPAPEETPGIVVITRYSEGIKLSNMSKEEIASIGAKDPSFIQEIRKVIVFQWMFRLKVGGVNEEYIEIFTPSGPKLPFATTRTKEQRSIGSGSGSDELTKPILQKWFDGDINKFSEILGDMLRPYSRELLQRKIERVIGAYHPEVLKRDDIKTWLKSVYDTVFPYT
jgi:hypothetical protein